MDIVFLRMEPMIKPARIADFPKRAGSCRLYRLLLSLVLLVLGGQLAFAQTTFTGGAGGNIPDATSIGADAGNPNAGIFTSDIVISGPGTIISFNSITLDDFCHTYIGDLVLELTHVDSGTTIFFMNRPLKVSALNGWGSDSDLNGTYTFINDLGSTYGSSDSIWLAATNNSTVPGGTYAASANSFTGSPTTSYVPINLNVFAGESIAGTWELTIRDESTNDIGTLSSWQFNATIEPVPEPASSALMLCGAIVSFVLVSFWRKPA